MLETMVMRASDQRVSHIDARGVLVPERVADEEVTVFSVRRRREQLAGAVAATQFLPRDVAHLVAQYTVAQRPAMLMHHRRLTPTGGRCGRLVAHFSADDPAMPLSQHRWGERDLGAFEPRSVFCHAAPRPRGSGPTPPRPTGSPRWDGALWVVPTLRRCAAFDQQNWCTPYPLVCHATTFDADMTVVRAIATRAWLAAIVDSRRHGGGLTLYAAALPRNPTFSSDGALGGGATGLPLSHHGDSALPQQWAAYQLRWKLLGNFNRCKVLEPSAPPKKGGAAAAVPPTEYVTAIAPTVCGEGDSAATAAGADCAPQLLAFDSTSQTTCKFILREDGEFESFALGSVVDPTVGLATSDDLYYISEDHYILNYAANSHSRVVADDGAVYSCARRTDSSFNVTMDARNNGRVVFKAGGVVSYLAFPY